MKAELIDHMGDDLRVVNAARVSFDKESELEAIIEDREQLVQDWYYDDYGSMRPETVRKVLPTKIGEKISDKDVKLIKYLAKHGHWTPFAHPTITLRETVPIFVARQRFKHMVGFSYNEVSRRYVDGPVHFHIPKVWRKRPDGSVKQGSSEEEVGFLCLGPDGDQVRPLPQGFSGTGRVSQAYARMLDYADDLYNEMILSGICPEQARMVLPQSMMTSYYVTGSLAAWSRAYVQRSDSHAQLEIQELAKEWDKVIRPLFPVSWSALVDRD